MCCRCFFPLGSSVLFGVYPGGTGYRILFLVAFAVSVAALALILSPGTPAGEESGRTMYYLYAHRVFWRNRWACASLLVSTLDGMRAGVMAFFLNVLLYSMVDSEALVGVNTLITTLCSIVAFAIMRAPSASTGAIDPRSGAFLPCFWPLWG